MSSMLGHKSQHLGDTNSRGGPIRETRQLEKGEEMDEKTLIAQNGNYPDQIPQRIPETVHNTPTIGNNQKIQPSRIIIIMHVETT